LQKPQSRTSWQTPFEKLNEDIASGSWVEACVSISSLVVAQTGPCNAVNPSELLAILNSLRGQCFKGKGYSSVRFCRSLVFAFNMTPALTSNQWAMYRDMADGPSAAAQLHNLDSPIHAQSFCVAVQAKTGRPYTFGDLACFLCMTSEDGQVRAERAAREKQRRVRDGMPLHWDLRCIWQCVLENGALSLQV